MHVSHLGKGLKHSTYLLGKTAVEGRWSALETRVRLLVVICAGLLDNPGINVDLLSGQKLLVESLSS